MSSSLPPPTDLKFWTASAGRFDRQVRVELPDLKGREAILEVHLRKIKLGEDIDVNLIARMTAGASGAQPANIVNEAALRAVGWAKITSRQPISRICQKRSLPARKKNAILSKRKSVLSPITNWSRACRRQTIWSSRCKDHDHPQTPARWATHAS